MAYVPKACGFVVARSVGAGWRYLLLTSRKWSEPGFPKGHVDEGETELETARRETEEEAGLTGLDRAPGFRHSISYAITRKGRAHDKEAVYFLAKISGETVRLSDEHSGAGWYDLAEARTRLPHENTRQVLRAAALHLKDPALFDQEPKLEAEADAWLSVLPEAHDGLLAHLRGSARLARALAEALADADAPVHVEAAAVGTLLHDTGRALGRHDDHQLAGLAHLRASPFAAYAFACVSHFTKGATAKELLAAEMPEPTVRAFTEAIDTSTFTWEEKCAALADACMSKDRPVAPAARFAELRERYGAVPIIDLQERRTAIIRAEFETAIREDPLARVGLA